MNWARRDHYVEPTVPSWLDGFIEANAESVLVGLRVAENTMPDCLSAVIAWRLKFEAAGIRVVQLGRQSDNRSWREGGGFAIDGERTPRDHHFLAVGPTLVLFDPTWRRFAAYGPPSLERYVVFDGRRFEDWRDEALAA